jgi:DNA-binding response OmpR family regulator
MSAPILVVDRDPAFRRCLQVSLQAAGFVVYLAPSGQEALAILRKVAIDLVMVDAKLVEAIGFLRGSALPSSRELPILVMASSKSPEDVLAAFVAGADEYVIKPFSLSEVTACIHKQLSACGRPLRPIARMYLAQGIPDAQKYSCSPRR